MTARALAIVHTCIYDAWAAYTPRAIGTRLGGFLRRPIAEHTLDNKSEAISYAAHRALVDLYPSEAIHFDTLMTSLGYDPADLSTDLRTPRGIGNRAAQAVLAFRHGDGSNQVGDLHPGAYSDYTEYRPVNHPDHITDPNRWQPLRVSDGHGGFVIQQYIAPHWGLVTPFALASGAQLRPAIGPAKYPSREYQAQAEQILQYSAHLDDEQKVIAEYWADGPSSELPPGHWCLFAQFISQRDGHDLDTDVKLYFILANALFDASIACWDAKRAFDFVRPITAIHALFEGKQVRAWAGPGQGTKKINGEDWQPYQPATVVTPAFPEYFSGHSTFSAAAAEVLRRFTGSDRFGASYTQAAGTSRVEPGVTPTSAVTLSWATFSDAANQAGLSRRYGGIHFEDGDLTGRTLGRSIAAQVWDKAQSYITGGEYRGEDSQARNTAYAPYWYIDASTDSLIEIKNHLSSELSLQLTLFLSSDVFVTPPAIVISGFSTRRITIRDHLQEHLGAGPRTSPQERWGDGSRVGSLLGSALLVPLTPEGTSLEAFSAWVVTEAPAEGLVLPTPFVPATASDIFETVCWLPYPGTRAFLALQNISGAPLDVTLHSSGDYPHGSYHFSETHRLTPFGCHLLDVTALLQTRGNGRLSPGGSREIVGGVRVTYAHEDVSPRPAFLLGRGLLIDEERGFSSPFITHIPIGDVPRDAITEIHAPALLFGRLATLLPRSTAQMHPHLLVRNISSRQITANTTISGRSAHGNAIQWLLEPIKLAPGEIRHIDLEERRRLSQSGLADGVAGLRLVHDGAPTDIISELVNVDESGDIVIYDRMRNLFFHQPVMQVAISFDLSEGRQTFLILKNVTDQTQEARVVLDYNDGWSQYNVDLPPIPAQQVAVIDIKQLRDAHVPDRNGSTLPDNVTFGGAVVLSDPGVFVGADPTFVFRPHERTGADTVFAIIENPGGGMTCMGIGSDRTGSGPPMDPPPHDYPGSPFRPETGPCLIFQGCGGNHKGVDIGFAGLRDGEPVLAMERGTVTDVERNKQPGDATANAVILQDQFGVITVYAHVTPRDGLGRGQIVDQGSVIGTVDQSGRSSDPHVEIRRLRPGPNTYQDIVNRIANGEGLCNFTVPCRPL